MGAIRTARCLGVLLDGRAQETGIRRLGTDATLLLVLNAHTDTVQFQLPEAVGGAALGVPSRHQRASTRMRWSDFAFGDPRAVTGRSLLLFILEPTHRASSSAAERSFQHVMQAFEEALSRALAMPAAQGPSEAAPD